jgi:hypothetical protein
VSFQDPNQREEWARRSAAEAEERAEAAAMRHKLKLELAKHQAATEPGCKSALDRLVEEARRHNLQIVTATWDGTQWHATFSRSGA